MLADLTKSRAAATYAALTEIERLASLIPSAPALADRMAVADAISQRYGRYRASLGELEGAPDPRSGMASAAPAVDEALRRVEPGDWWEGLAAVVLGAPLTDELFSALLGDGGAPADDVQEAPTDEAADAAALWAEQRLQAAIGADPVLAARIALWGRRLVGEAIVLAREFGGERYPELADRLAADHLRRLTGLGLAG